MIRLVALYGVGDAYLVCGLARAFEQHHGYGVRVVVKSAQAAIPAMFGLEYNTDDAGIVAAEGDNKLHREYENILADGHTFYVHPHFLRSGSRIDQLTVKSRVSQADMYRALLRLSPWAALETPGIDVKVYEEIILLPMAKSWPNLPMPFWNTLASRLRNAGKPVRFVEPGWPLDQLIDRCAGAPHVIGAQCGVMSLLCEMRLPCRKTFAICELTDKNPGVFGITHTMPYGHAITFAGNDHLNVRHFVVSPHNWEASIEPLAAGI